MPYAQKVLALPDVAFCHIVLKTYKMVSDHNLQL